MSDLARVDPSWATWLAPPSKTKVPDFLMGEALVLIAAAQGRPIDEAGVVAYRMALADVDPEDFRAGLRQAFQVVRFFTPAAIRECCDAARGARLAAIADAQRAEEDERRAAEFAEAKRLRDEREARLSELLSAGERAEALKLALQLRRPSVGWACASLAFTAEGHVQIMVAPEHKGYLGYLTYRAERAIEEIGLEILGERITAVELVLVERPGDAA